MANEIHNYALEKYRIGDDDYFDMDYWDGLVYTTAKIKGQFMRSGMFAQTVDGPIVTATTTESAILSAGVGSLIVPPDTFQVGDTFNCVVKGHLSTHNNDTIIFRIKSGSTILADSSAITMPTLTSKHFELDLVFTVRATGPSGVAQLVTHGNFCYNKNSSNAYEGEQFIDSITTGFDTTVANSLDITVQFNSTNAGNSIQTQIVNLYKTY